MFDLLRKLTAPPPDGYFIMPVRIAVIAALALVLFSVVTHAEEMTCTSSQVCLSWQPPLYNEPTEEDGPTAIYGSLIGDDQKPLKYNVYRKGTFGPIAETQGHAIKFVNEPRGEQCYAVQTVDVKGAMSVLTEYVCKTVRFPGPSDGAIDAPTDGGIEPTTSPGD
jgi:hypothetical protein